MKEQTSDILTAEAFVFPLVNELRVYGDNLFIYCGCRDGQFFNCWGPE